MDWLLTWHILQGVLTFGLMVLTAASIIALWRLRGIFNWRRSLSNELKELNKETEAAGQGKRQALKVVQERCHRIWHAPSPELKELADISLYVHSIATCYYPGKERPELRISIGRFLQSANDSVDRLELILRRPGFQRLRGIRIRHIRNSYEWYDRVSHYWIVRWVHRYRKLLAKMFQLRLVIVPDPFSWLAYLSNRLTMLTLTRCLLVDIYLFVGRLAIQVYDEEEKEEPDSFKANELEKTLEDFDSLEPSEPDITDPKILEIRNRLVGISSMLMASPGLTDWKNAVEQAANVIAKKYFPDAERPLEEAALGPLLTRIQMWIKSVCKTEKMPVVKRFHRIRIQSLYRVKSFTDIWLPKQVRIFAKKTWSMYRWMKWPLIVYRGVKTSSPIGIAINVGWILSKKAFANFLCRYTFDIACEELEIIYRQSRDMAAKNKQENILPARS